MSTPDDLIEAEIFKILEIFEKNCSRFKVETANSKERLRNNLESEEANVRRKDT